MLHIANPFWQRPRERELGPPTLVGVPLIAKHAHVDNLTLKAAGPAIGPIDEASFDRLVRPETMG